MLFCIFQCPAFTLQTQRRLAPHSCTAVGNKLKLILLLSRAGEKGFIVPHIFSSGSLITPWCFVTPSTRLIASRLFSFLPGCKRYPLRTVATSPNGLSIADVQHTTTKTTTIWLLLRLGFGFLVCDRSRNQQRSSVTKQLIWYFPTSQKSTVMWFQFDSFQGPVIDRLITHEFLLWHYDHKQLWQWQIHCWNVLDI